MARKATGQVLEVPRKGSDVVFAVRFRANGKRRFQTLGKRSDGWSHSRAQEELENILADVRRGIWREPDPARTETEPRPVPTFHEFASGWFQARKVEGGRSGRGLTAAGEADLKWQLSNHLLPEFASKRIDEIGIEDVDRYRRSKVQQGAALGATSINKTIATLSAILEQAVEYGHISRNPAKGRRRRLPSTRPARTYLDCAEHIAALLAAAGELDSERRGPPWRRALLATLTLAGPRIDECLSLQWAHVSLGSGRLHVPGTKTAAAVRAVDLLPLLRDELASYAAITPDREPDAFVFATGTGAKQGATNIRRRVLAPAVARADARLAASNREPMPAGLTPHSLRRSFASVLIALGRDPAYVMAQMGHTTPNLTLALYAQAMRRQDGENERLRALIDGTLELELCAGSATAHHNDPTHKEQP